MKKFLALMLALICLMSFAFADALDVPSKDTGAMTEVTLDEEYEGLELAVGEDEEDLPETIVEVLATEIKKLAESKSVAAYFEASLKDAEGEKTTLKDVLGEEPTKVSEFTTLSVDGYEADEMGAVTVTFQFATPYEKDEKVAVLVGFIDADDNSIEWYVFEGVGTGVDGAIEVEFPEDIMTKIAETPAEYVLLAVASL